MSKYKQAKKLLRRWKQRHPDALEDGDPILDRVLEALGEDQPPLTGATFVDSDVNKLCRQIQRLFETETLDKSSFEDIEVSEANNDIIWLCFDKHNIDNDYNTGYYFKFERTPVGLLLLKVEEGFCCYRHSLDLAKIEAPLECRDTRQLFHLVGQIIQQ